MPTTTFQPPEGQQDTAQLQDWIIKLVRDLNYYMNNLDTVNINRLDAKVIIANTITANKMNVQQLSAIAADLGTITAGIIYGAYIATANGTYPRIELSSSANLLTAYLDANNHLSIMPNLGGVPALRFTNASSIVGHLSAGASVALSASGVDIDINSTTNVNISATNLVNFDNWSKLRNSASLRTLQTDLDAKLTNVSGGSKFQSGTITINVTVANTWTAVSLTFPTAFANPPVLTTQFATAGATNNLARGDGTTAESITASTATIFANCANIGTKTIHWIAVGT